MNPYNSTIITDKSKIPSALLQLDWQVISFNVANLRGAIIAVVKNVYIDKQNNLHLLISPLNNSDENLQYLMSGDWVQQIGIAKKILVVNLNESDITHLPLVSQVSTYTDNSASEINTAVASSLVENPISTTSHSSNSDEVTVPLLEERLLVKHEKRQLGEVIIRKKVETHLVQVPVRREILIIEQVGSPNKQLTEIDLADSKVPGVVINSNDNTEVNFVVKGELISPQIASEILRDIALQEKHGCKKISLEIEVENHEQQVKYQEIINRKITS